MICDHLPDFGRIREHDFTTTLGAGVRFVATSVGKFGGYNLHVNTGSPVWTSRELRELASECVMLAEHLEKRGLGVPDAG